MAEDLPGFIERVGAQARFYDRPILERTVRATLEALGAALGGVPFALREAIPLALHADLEAGRTLPRVGPAASYLMLSNEIGLRIGTALELTHAIVSELADAVGPGQRAQLKAHLPPAWAALVLEPSGGTRPTTPVASAMRF